MGTLYLNSLFLWSFSVSQIGVRHLPLWPARRHPLIVNLPRRIRKPGEVSVCLTLQLRGPSRHTHLFALLLHPVAFGCCGRHPRCSRLLPMCAFENPLPAEA